MITVGLGVIILNDEGKILVGKRISKFAPYYSIPGGNIEEGETFEEAARREIKEETGIVLKKVKVIGVTNNLITYKEFGKHTVSVCLFSDDFDGEPKILEPDKSEGWEWVDPNLLPNPHADFSRMQVSNWLNDRFYQEYF